MSRAAKRFLKLWFSWSIVLTVVIAGFWGIWYAFAGHVPANSLLCFDMVEKTPFFASGALSRWWDIAAAPFLGLAFITLIRFFHTESVSTEEARNAIIGPSVFIGLFSLICPYAALILSCALGALWTILCLVDHYMDASQEPNLPSKVALLTGSPLIPALAVGLSRGMLTGLNFYWVTALFVTATWLGIFYLVVGGVAGIRVALRLLNATKLISRTQNYEKDARKDRVRDYLDKQYPAFDKNVAIADIMEKKGVTEDVVMSVVDEYRERDSCLRVTQNLDGNKVLHRNYNPA